RLTFCGLPPPSSLIETCALRLPLAAGVKVTLIRQLAPEATLVPHFLFRSSGSASRRCEAWVTKEDSRIPRRGREPAWPTIWRLSQCRQAAIAFSQFLMLLLVAAS